MAERERMSREIHDTLAQGFTSVIMLSQTAVADLRRELPDQAVERLLLIERMARENLAEARALVAAAAPVGLAESTLAEALERLAVRFSQETGVRVRVVADDDTLAGLPRDREVVLLRAAQEALSNIRRHADARNVDLVLATEPAGADGTGPRDGTGPAVHLEVVDDGQGMDPAAVEGYGLRGMRDRVTSEGGRLTVTSGVGVGTRVQVTMPAAPDAAPDAAADDAPGTASDITKENR
jgi:signal transduction histidine kinase